MSQPPNRKNMTNRGRFFGRWALRLVLAIFLSGCTHSPKIRPSNEIEKNNPTTELESKILQEQQNVKMIQRELEIIQLRHAKITAWVPKDTLQNERSKTYSDEAYLADLLTTKKILDQRIKILVDQITKYTCIGLTGEPKPTK